jgi:hypothetical protein
MMEAWSSEALEALQDGSLPSDETPKPTTRTKPTGALHDSDSTESTRFSSSFLKCRQYPLPRAPPLLKRIRQSSRYELWRLGHPYHVEVCVRLIVHFHGSEAVVVLVGGDKLGVSDQSYDTAVNQANAALDHYYRQHQAR